MPNWLANTLRIIIVVTLPLVLVVTNVRLMLTPLYINWEYNLKDFPPDLYGFTKEDRLKYAAIALDYLNNSAGIEFLGNLTIPDNQIANADSGHRMYNDRELKHMVDVKKVVQGAMMAWMIGGLLLVGSMLALASGPDTRPLLRGALLIGAGIILMLAHNWEDLSRPVRAALSFLPLLLAQGLAGWALVRRPESLAWREGTGALLF